MITGQIDLGSLIAGASVIITLVVLHSTNVRRITRIEVRVDALWEKFIRDQI